MKILFTGCSGFIGSAVLGEAIKKYGKENIYVLSSSPIDEVQTVIHNGYEFKPDIFIDNGLSDIEILVHMGAFTPKDQAEANNIQKSNSNIYNTGKLLFAELPNLRKIIFTSTLDVYAVNDIISEESEESPASLYGFSKLYCEKMIKNFAESKQIIYQILRIGHVFGPGEEKYKKIIPVTISNLIKNNTVELFGDGQAIRTFIYIDDVVKAILNAIELPQSEDVTNVVGETQISIEDLAKALIDIHGSKETSIKYIPVVAKNRNLIFDNTKLRERLLDRFTPIVDGLRKEYLYMKEKIDREHIL
ncbi:UDP-glucose 4-epimerase [Spirochaetia bacterium]|nr:UDP-glucose 4-epimerase [Spirochaetia bacterium]